MTLDHERPSRQNETSQDPSTSQTKLPHAALRSRWSKLVEDGDAIRAASFAATTLPSLLDENERLRARIAELEKAGREFLAQYDVCEPAITSAFFLAFTNRGGNYSGPTYEREMNALRAAALGGDGKESGNG